VGAWFGSGFSVVGLVRDTLVVWFVGSLALSLFARSERVWLKPSLEFSHVTQYLGAGNLESHTQRSTALQKVADWILHALPDDARLLDCTPMSLWLLHPKDSRYLDRFRDQLERDRLCSRLLSPGAAGRPDADYVIASDINEFRGPETLTPGPFVQRAAQWKMIYGIDINTLEEFHGGEPKRDLRDVILVFQRR
jgi:hypothetical protein